MAFVVAVWCDLPRSRSTDAARRRRPSRGRQTAVAIRQVWEALGMRRSATKENDMRPIFIAALGGLGIDLCAVRPGLASPACDAATASAAEFARPVEQACWRPYSHRR